MPRVTTLPPSSSHSRAGFVFPCATKRRRGSDTTRPSRLKSRLRPRTRGGGKGREGKGDARAGMRCSREFLIANSERMRRGGGGRRRRIECSEDSDGERLRVGIFQRFESGRSRTNAGKTHARARTKHTRQRPPASTQREQFPAA